MSKTLITGLIGYPLSHSFSQKYFTDKFAKEGISGFVYQNFEIDNIDQIRNIIDQNPELIGLNVTIPYKEKVIPYLNELSEQAEKIGAVNTICIKQTPNGIHLSGHNTDLIGFGKSIDMFLKTEPKGALILGTGGASKAVNYLLDQRSIKRLSVSRTPGSGRITYADIQDKTIREYPLIINTSPLGMFPKIEEKPDIPYHLLSQRNFLIDLIYNPDETLFLKLGKRAGAATLNGLPMLIAQAEASWELWIS